MGGLAHQVQRKVIDMKYNVNILANGVSHGRTVVNLVWMVLSNSIFQWNLR